MKRIKYWCDICKKKHEKEEITKKIKLPIGFNGHFENGDAVYHKYDICRADLKKIINFIKSIINEESAEGYDYINPAVDCVGEE